jgi:hypothetical protein
MPVNLAYCEKAAAQNCTTAIEANRIKRQLKRKEFINVSPTLKKD